jgi:hypothetical protein
MSIFNTDSPVVPPRVAVVVGLVAFCVGSGGLFASMILDGFVSPALAARFTGTDSPDNLAMARTLLIFCGTSIRFFMPLAIAFQSVAMLSWSSVLVGASGLRRGVGAFGSICAVLLVIALLAAPARQATHLLMAGICTQALWYLGIAAVLVRHTNVWLSLKSDPTRVAFSGLS